MCHYCQHVETPRVTCARCGGATLRRRGLGTQQVERLLAERFPNARLARMDIDTTSGKWAHADILDRVGRGDVDILLGTQMIAKGLDFANVTLVGVIDADVGINLPDFRASERCLPAPEPSRGPGGAGAQRRASHSSRRECRSTTLCSARSLTTTAASWRRNWWDDGHPRIRPSHGWPTSSSAGSPRRETAGLAERGAAWLRRRVEAANAGAGITIIGPAPCPVERIKDRWRWHVLVKSRAGGPRSRRWGAGSSLAFRCRRVAAFAWHSTAIRWRSFDGPAIFHPVTTFSAPDFSAAAFQGGPRRHVRPGAGVAASCQRASFRPPTFPPTSASARRLAAAARAADGCGPGARRAG